MFSDYKYYVLLNENGRLNSSGYRENDENIPEKIKKDGYLITKEEFDKLRNGYFRNPENGKYEIIPPYVPTLDELKEVKITEIYRNYYIDLEAIVWIDQANGSLYGYDTDKQSQIDFLASYNRAKIDGTTRYNVYLDPTNLKSKSFIVHTPGMFETAFSAAGIYQEEIYVKFYTKKQEIKNATTEEELMQISW